ncbi:hypothetical protein EDB87DRAFT_1586850 [Lactarius vividus]|nr:hypothetical protein EDB87DRAFT_1586850 [Lactarius vividus]
MSATQTQTDPPTPTWPSLYDPLIEFHDLEHHAPIQPGGRYLTQAGDVFRFTFYWTLIFNSLFFLITGGIATFNIIFPSRRDKHGDTTAPPGQKHTPQAAPHSHSMIPLTPVASAQSPDLLLSHPGPAEIMQPGAPQPRKNVHRSRLTYAIFTLFVFLVTAVGASFVESAVVGYVLWAVYTAGDFNISTWLPPVWALIIASSVLLGAFPSVIDRI